MSISKTEAKAPDKPARGAAIQEQPALPKRQGRPSSAGRAPVSGTSSAGNGASPGCPADLMTAILPNSGAVSRARLMTSLQRTVGNARVGQMLAASQASEPASLIIQRQGKGSPGAVPARQVKRQDVVVIVGRPSQTTPGKETPKQKEQIEAWRGAAYALSPVVFEGLTVDQAFVRLRKHNQPIGKLYIISHADESGIGEVSPRGQPVVTTVRDLTGRIKKATGALGPNKPESVEMLSCFGGGSPKSMGEIGETLGAKQVRAPARMTVISGRTINVNGKRLTAAIMRNLPDKTLGEYIQKTDLLKHYDFVAGVPHPDKTVSNEEKLKALAGALRQTGMISFISYNSEPGKRDAVPFWKATVKKRRRTEEVSGFEQLSNKGLIEVDVQETAKEP